MSFSCAGSSLGAVRHGLCALGEDSVFCGGLCGRWNGAQLDICILMCVPGLIVTFC